MVRKPDLTNNEAEVVFDPFSVIAFGMLSVSLAGLLVMVELKNVLIGVLDPKKFFGLIGLLTAKQVSSIKTEFILILFHSYKKQEKGV